MEEAKGLGSPLKANGLPPKNKDDRKRRLSKLEKPQGQNMTKMAQELKETAKKLKEAMAVTSKQVEQQEQQAENQKILVTAGQHVTTAERTLKKSLEVFFRNWC